MRQVSPCTRTPSTKAFVYGAVVSEGEGSSTERDEFRNRTEAVYRRHDVDSFVLLYSGDVRIEFDGIVHVCPCDIRLEGDGDRLLALVAGDEPWFARAVVADDMTVEIIDGADLDPRVEPLLSPAEVRSARVSWSISLGRHRGGEIQAFSLFVVHVNARWTSCRVLALARRSSRRWTSRFRDGRSDW
jgi:hypothetical protein